MRHHRRVRILRKSNSSAARCVPRDFCQGLLRAIVVDGNDVIHYLLGAAIDRPSSFGEGADGELYVLSLRGEVYRIDPA